MEPAIIQRSIVAGTFPAIFKAILDRNNVLPETESKARPRDFAILFS